MSARLPPLPKASDPLPLMVRLSARTTGALITWLPLATVMAAPLPELLSVSELAPLPLIVYPSVLLAELPSTSVPIACGASSVTVSGELVGTLIVAHAPAALGTGPVHLLASPQLPLTAAAHALGPATSNCVAV